MLIREATPNDCDQILAIDRVARQQAERVEFIRRSLLSATCPLAGGDGQVVGYGVLEHTFFGQGFISMLFVAEEARRQRTGTALMEALAARCSTRKLFTSTNESNRPMQSLLGSLGYVPSGIIENLDAGDPELVYFLDLGRSVRQPIAGTAEVEFVSDLQLDNGELNALFAAAWPEHAPRDFRPIFARSLTWVVAQSRGRLVGYVNVAGDGGDHAFLLDPTVHPEFQRRGIGTALVRRAAEVARLKGAEWLHVDFESRLAAFYRKAGYQVTRAGLLRLRVTASRAV